MAINLDDVSARQSRYAEQAGHAQFEADRHRRLAAEATNPVDRRAHEQAVIACEAQMAELQGMAREMQTVRENAQQEMIAREAERAAAAEQAVREATEAEARAESAAEEGRAAEKRSRERAAEIERELQEARERIERGRRRGRTPFD